MTLLDKTEKSTAWAQELNEIISNKEVSEVWTVESLRVIIKEIVLYEESKIRPNNLEIVLRH